MLYRLLSNETTQDILFADRWMHHPTCIFTGREPLIQMEESGRNGRCAHCGILWVVYSQWVRPLNAHEQMAFFEQQTLPPQSLL